jgi:hypothetical protein
MTLEAYSPERLDALALRVLDLCVHLRAAARTCREHDLAAVELHDRKALEWLEKLEQWAIGTEAELFRRAKIAQGARAAEGIKSRGK